MLMQTLVGAWPPELSPDDGPGLQRYLDRIAQWTTKALREGKQLSNWFEPDPSQEAAWLAYLQAMNTGGPHHPMLRPLHAFVCRIQAAGLANGLIQTALRLTCPGISDLYQGTEWLDFSLVDPDNRSPVDFGARARCLEEMTAGWQDAASEWRPPLQTGGWPAKAWVDGRIKQSLVATLLALRREQAAAFRGDYRPLPVSETFGKLVAFSRENDVVVVAGVKCAARLRPAADGTPALPADYWGKAALTLPGGPAVWRDVLRGRTLQAPDGPVAVADLLAGLPLAVLSRNQG